MLSTIFWVIVAVLAVVGIIKLIGIILPVILILLGIVAVAVGGYVVYKKFFAE